MQSKNKGGIKDRHNFSTSKTLLFCGSLRLTEKNKISREKTSNKSILEVNSYSVSVNIEA